LQVVVFDCKLVLRALLIIIFNVSHRYRRDERL